MLSCGHWCACLCCQDPWHLSRRFYAAGLQTRNTLLWLPSNHLSYFLFFCPAPYYPSSVLLNDFFSSLVVFEYHLNCDPWGHIHAVSFDVFWRHHLFIAHFFVHVLLFAVASHQEMSGIFHCWKDGFLTELGHLCSLKMYRFLGFVPQDWIKNKIKGLWYNFILKKVVKKTQQPRHSVALEQ